MEWEDKLGTLLQYLEDALVTSKDFAVEQAPLIVQEFFMWFTAQHIFYMFIGFIVLYMAYRLHLMGLDESEKNTIGRDWYKDDTGFFPWAFYVGISMGISFLLIFINLYKLIQIIIAPRIYLIEKIQYWLN